MLLTSDQLTNALTRYSPTASDQTAILDSLNSEGGGSFGALLNTLEAPGLSAVAGAHALLYTGSINEPGGGQIEAFNAANRIASKSGGQLYTIDATDVGQFLGGKTSIGDPFAAVYDDINARLSGMGASPLNDAGEAAVREIAWQDASAKLVADAPPGMFAITGTIDPKSAYAMVEIPNSQAKTVIDPVTGQPTPQTINGVQVDSLTPQDIPVFQQQSDAGTARFFENTSYTASTDSITPTPVEPSPPGTVSLSDVFTDAPSVPAAASDTMRAVATAAENLGKLGGVASAALSTLRALGGVLTGVGLGLTVLDGFSSGAQATEQVLAKNYTGAANTLTSFAARLGFGLTGSVIGAAEGGELGAFLGSALGPAGAAVGGAAGALIGGVVGGIIGATTAQAAVDEINDFLNRVFNAGLYGLLGNLWNDNPPPGGGLLSPPGGDPATPPGGSGGPGGAGGELGNGNHQISPLVLDLTGTGINLTALSYTSPYFDLTNDGFARKTGWIGTGTGLLVLPNGIGQVNNITELFGNNSSSPNGFAALALYDSNHDGVINANDAIFSRLRVWTDTNDNGVVDAGELYTLPELGILSINLAATAVNETIAGNTVSSVGSYTMADGTQRTIADAWFSNSPTFTRPDTPITIPANIAALPQLNGYGTMADLQSVMTTDPILLGLVESFVALPVSTDPSTIKADLQAIAYEWAGVTSFHQNYGTLIDPREAAFLSAYTGLSFSYSEFSAPRQADNISQGWVDAFDGIEARLVLQTGLSAQVPEFTYNAGFNFVLPVTTLYASFASGYARLGHVTAANLSGWDLFDRVADAFRMDAHLSSSAYEGAIAEVTSDTIASVANAISNDIQITFDGNGNIVETGVDLGSVFYAGPGISKLVGEGAGAVPLNAVGWQKTADIYNYDLGDGTVEIDGQGDPNNTTNTLQFGAGIVASQIVLSRGSSSGIILTVDASGDQITLDNMVSRTYDGGLFAISFADGSSWTAQQLDSMVIATGTPTQTRLIDQLGGATFDPKGYAHFAEGGLAGGGNDTFLYNQGYGNLEIDEEDDSPSPNDALKFGTGILASDVAVTGVSGGGIVLTLQDGSAITLDYMWSRTDYGVQEVLFADGTIWSEQQLFTAETTGSPTNTSLYNDHGGTVFDPTGYAHFVSALNLGAGDTCCNQAEMSVCLQSRNVTLALICPAEP